MQESVIERIQAQQKKYQEDDLEYALAELMMDLCETEPQAAELIAQDIDKQEMTLEKCARHMEDYARKNKKGNSYGMNDRKARRIVREFYGIPAPDDKPPAPTYSGTTQDGILDIMDLI